MREYSSERLGRVAKYRQPQAECDFKQTVTMEHSIQHESKNGLRWAAQNINFSLIINELDILIGQPTAINWGRTS